MGVVPCAHLEEVKHLVPDGEVAGCPQWPGEDWSWCYEDEVFFRLAAG
jgi:hypothetical protein